MRISDWSSDVCSSDLREIALAVLGPADLAFDGVAGTQAEFTNLIGRDVDVVGTSEIVRLGAAQETETVGQHLDRAEPHDLITEIGLFLEDAEQQILLAQRRGALDPQFFGHFDQFGGSLLLQVFEMHGESPVRACDESASVRSEEHTSTRLNSSH